MATEKTLKITSRKRKKEQQVNYWYLKRAYESKEMDFTSNPWILHNFIVKHPIKVLEYNKQIAISSNEEKNAELTPSLGFAIVNDKLRITKCKTFFQIPHSLIRRWRKTLIYVKK